MGEGFDPKSSRHTLRIVAKGTVKGRRTADQLHTMMPREAAGEIEWIEDRRVRPAQFSVTGPRFAQSQQPEDSIFDELFRESDEAAMPPTPAERPPTVQPAPSEAFERPGPEPPSSQPRESQAAPAIRPPARPYEDLVPPLNEGRIVPDVPDGYDCQEHQRLCDESIQQLRQRNLDQISLDISFHGTPGQDYPCTCTFDIEDYRPRQYAPLTFQWVASSVCHKPLYFEQIALERYGHTVPLAHPLIAAGCFYGTLPILPYKMGMNPPWECMYPLGHYRPGNCAPYQIPPFPLSWRGAAVEGAVATGLAFTIP